MTSNTPPDADDRRNDAPRLRLAADAVFIGMEGRQRVTILDLSQVGAKVAFSEPPSEKAGFISWMQFETFGDVVWREGLYVGLKFDQPIPQSWLAETHRAAPPVDDYQHAALLKAAREWVEG